MLPNFDTSPIGFFLAKWRHLIRSKRVHSMVFFHHRAVKLVFGSVLFRRSALWCSGTSIRPITTGYVARAPPLFQRRDALASRRDRSGAHLLQSRNRERPFTAIQ